MVELIGLLLIVAFMVVYLTVAGYGLASMVRAVKSRTIEQQQKWRFRAKAACGAVVVMFLWFYHATH